MSMNRRYEGSFYSTRGTLYTIQIWQEGFDGQATEIAFSASPLEIEWQETDKIEPVQSSRATLQLYSDSDRQFVDLYTIEVGTIRMDVLREGNLYWSGTLDPELYEEPFAFKNGYNVSLTFSDMAILERLNWIGTGFRSLREVITQTLWKSGINYNGIDEQISIQHYTYDGQTLLDNVSVQTQNFFDEDGEPMTLREVLDDTLQPFALRLIQKNGKVMIYDLNKVADTANEAPDTLVPELIRWESNDSVLSVDKVYNNITLSYSPYEKVELLTAEIDRDSISDTGATQPTTYLGWNASYEEVGFKTYFSKNGKGMEINPNAYYYKIKPQYSGSEESGVMWRLVNHNSPTGGEYEYGNAISRTTGEMLLKVPYKAFIGNCGYFAKQGHLLRLNLQLLYDPRINPFEQASDNNNEKQYDRLKKWANFAYIPFCLTLCDEAGKALYHWENREVKESKSFISTNKRGWKPGIGSWGDAWLCWYDDDRKDATGLGGWQSNKQIVGYTTSGLPQRYNHMDKGEYIELPPVPGWLQLEIGTGIEVYNDNGKNWEVKNEVYKECRWFFLKDPKLVLTDPIGKAVGSDDVQLRAWLNRNAKESLELSTVFGTLAPNKPTALGLLYNTKDKQVIGDFWRNGKSDKLERLLIGTIYSNYATRHNKLSGTAALLPTFGIYCDDNESGCYLLTSERQRLIEDESEITMVQIEPDNYEGIKYDETV